MFPIDNTGNFPLIPSRAGEQGAFQLRLLLTGFMTVPCRYQADDGNVHR